MTPLTVSSSITCLAAIIKFKNIKKKWKTCNLLEKK